MQFVVIGNWTAKEPGSCFYGNVLEQQTREEKNRRHVNGSQGFLCRAVGSMGGIWGLPRAAPYCLPSAEEPPGACGDGGVAARASSLRTSVGLPEPPDPRTPPLRPPQSGPERGDAPRSRPGCGLRPVPVSPSPVGRRPRAPRDPAAPGRGGAGGVSPVGGCLVAVTPWGPGCGPL